MGKGGYEERVVFVGVEEVALVDRPEREPPPHL